MIETHTDTHTHTFVRDIRGNRAHGIMPSDVQRARGSSSIIYSLYEVSVTLLKSLFQSWEEPRTLGLDWIHSHC